jgi:DNA modification methylase
MAYQLINSDVIEGLRRLPESSIHCVVTSVPYLWQRDYGVDGQIGLEANAEEYILKLISVFAEVRRVMREDATLWVNIADSYANDSKWGGRSGNRNTSSDKGGYQRKKRRSGMPSKCLMAIPARFQVAMIDAGWICRNEIIWQKPTARPECVEDRCTRDHEQLFLFTKSPAYYFDMEAVKQPASPKSVTVKTSPVKGNGNGSAGERLSVYQDTHGRYYVEERNLRTVWSIVAEPSDDQHYAAFPSALPELCIGAGTSEYGCCIECGAPWRRVLEKVKGDPKSFKGSSFTGGKASNAATSYGVANGRDHSVGQGPRTIRIETKGWKPSCKCNEWYRQTPCIVLDPFCGKSTTGVAALRLGRYFYGIDLNPSYIEMSDRNLREAERQAYGPLFLPLVKQSEPQSLF